MNIEKINSYQKDLGFMKVIVVIIIFCFFAVTCFMYYTNLEFVKEKSKTVILVDQDNNTLLATEKKMTRFQRMAQLQNHVEDFYELFFEFDAITFNDRIESSLKLIGEDGAKLFNDYYTVSQFERNIKENNWTLYVEVEKVKVDMSKYPYHGNAIARQTLETKQYKRTRNLHATFVLRNAEVSYDNPVGALIEDFELYNNEMINSEELDN